MRIGASAGSTSERWIGFKAGWQIDSNGTDGGPCESIDLAVKIKLQCYVGLAKWTLRRHFGDAGNVPSWRSRGCGNARRYGLGIGPQEGRR
jgi:hypothetical protein